MGWLSGVLSGYSDRQGEIRRDAAARAEESNQREAAIYQHLLSSPDEKVRTMAATGLLQSSQPRTRKGGFAGWMGDMESNPMFPVLQKYMQTPQRKETVTPGLPSTQITGVMPPPHAESNPVSQQFANPVPDSALQLPDKATDETQPNLAQAETSPTTGGELATPQPAPGSAAAAPPPTPPAAVAPAAAPQAAAAPPAPPASLFTKRQVAGPAVGRTDVSYELPHAFPTAEESASAAALAKQKADIQADAWMYKQAHPEWSEAEAYQAAAKLAESHSGGGAGGLSSTYVKGGVISDPNSPTGFSRQWVLRRDPTQHQLLPEQPPNTPEYEYYKTQARRIATIARTPDEAWQEARKRNPQGTEEEQATQAQAIWEWSQQQMLAQRPNIPGFGQVRTGGGAQPGAPPTAGAPPAPGAAPDVAAPPPAPDFTKSIAPGYKDVSVRTGKPLGAATQQAVNEARATDALVDRALATLEPYKDRNDELDGLEMSVKYKKGIQDTLGVAAQIANLAALQSSATKALSAGGSRAYQFVVDKQQHTPRLPSDDQVAKYEFAVDFLGMDPEAAAKYISLWSRNKGHPVWDTPRMMIEKLQVVKRNLHDYIEDAMNVDVPEPGPANQNQPAAPPKPPPAVTGGGRGAAAAGGGRGGGSGRVDVNSDIVYGPNGATVVGR